MNLVIERGEQLLVGHYYEQEGDLISDPVLAMDYNKGHWYPGRIKQVLGDVTCSFRQDGKRMIHPDNIKECKLFQRMFRKEYYGTGMVGGWCQC